MTASTSPSCIDAIGRLAIAVDELDARRRRERRSELGGRRGAVLVHPAEGQRGRSPPPWKMNPNRKMKISGNASVQNSAARSRT